MLNDAIVATRFIRTITRAGESSRDVPSSAERVSSKIKAQTTDAKSETDSTVVPLRSDGAAPWLERKSVDKARKIPCRPVARMPKTSPFTVKRYS